MSKNRSIIYAFLAPLLYLAAQMAASLAVSAVASVYVMRDIGGGVPADELFEETLLRTLDAVSRYTNHIMFAACVLLVFTLMVAYRGRQPGLWQAVGLTRGAEPSALALAALAGFALNMASSGLLNGLPLPDDWLESYAGQMESLVTGGPVLVFAVIVICVPFTEELIFRGFTQRYMERAAGPWGAVITQAVLFSVFHMSPVQTAYTFFAGLMAGVIYMWTRSLWAPVAFHVLYNLSSFLIDGAAAAVLGDGEPPEWLFAVMAATGLTLAFFCLRSFRNRYGSKRQAAE